MNRQRASQLLLLASFIFAATTGCRPKESLVIINSPVTGQVRRVLASEGVAVAEGAAIIEIAVQPAGSPAPPDPREGSQPSVRQRAESSQAGIAAAEAEVARASVEVQRVEPLVASGRAPAAQLDAAKAQFHQAQERLQKAREAARSATDAFLFEQGRRAARPAPPREEIVAVCAPASGLLRVMSARAGQKVTAKQPLATLSNDRR